MNEDNFAQDVKERLVHFARTQYNKGQNYFESYCGVTTGTVGASKKNGMSTLNLAKIAERCPELSLRWLLLGEGEMLERRDGARSAGGNVTTIGNVSGMTGSSVTVNGDTPRGADGMKRVMETLADQNKALTRQIETLTRIITNLTAKG